MKTNNECDSIAEQISAASKRENAVSDGGPAFPRGVDPFGCVQNGMTLLDYFAGQAIVAMIQLMQKGLLKDYELGDDATMGQVVSSQAYGIARDMLKERERISEK